MMGRLLIGVFSDRTFRDGMFGDGMFSDGTFSDGTYCDGTYCAGTFSDGKFSNETFCMGTELYLWLVLRCVLTVEGTLCVIHMAGTTVCCTCAVAGTTMLYMHCTVLTARTTVCCTCVWNHCVLYL